MFQLRQLRGSDIPAAMHLKEAANWNQTERDWRNVLAVEPEGCFGIECDGVLAATATVVCYGRDLAWIGMVLTAPAYRGRGFARQLMERAVDYARRREVGWLKLDATDMGMPLYASLGFEPEGCVERWLRGGRPPAEPSAAPVAREFPLDLDRRAFGADRGRVLGAISMEFYSAGSEGYAMGRPGSNAAYFGPCVAESAAGARELRDAFLARHEGESVYWDVLGANPEAVRLAREAGFEPVRKLARMSLRGRPSPPPIGNSDALVFAIAGFEFG